MAFFGSRVTCFPAVPGLVSASLWLAALLPAQDEVEVAGDLFVDLDAGDPTAGTELWENRGLLDHFEERGDPVVTEHEGAPAVSFNEGATQNDAYQCAETAPPGLIGIDADRTIEVWVYNQDIASEETLVAWGRRGGPDGSNMSFNYGSHFLFSAIGHWGGNFPDIGWGVVPPAAQWHHLVYTYDGTTTRVYADGHISNIEYLGPGVINTHPNSRITLAAQYLPDGVNLDFGAIKGALAMGRVRVHDGVLSDQQILKNYFLERPEFPLLDEAPAFLNAPSEDLVPTGVKSYSRQLRTSGFPLPAFEVSKPAGATISKVGLLEFTLPQPAPDSFEVAVKAASAIGSAEATWAVTVLKPDSPIQAAGELFVDVDAADPTAGTATWANAGTLGDFNEVGDPELVTIDGQPAVSFNSTARGDAYQSANDAPAGLVDLSPTRSIEAWVFNPAVGAEEGVVAWGRRGGPAGTNMSLNHGTSVMFGAVTHWGGDFQDIGWGGTVPPAAQWTYLAYTFDGSTTRVYHDGVEATWESLGPDAINTAPLTKITLGAQVAASGLEPDFGTTRGSLAIGKVRVHDEVLTPAQVLHNYTVERKRFPFPPRPSFTVAPPEGESDLAVTVDGSGSTSPNGAITSYSWDFGDGETAAGIRQTHTYTKAGRFTITLTVVDERQADGAATQAVVVHFRSGNVAPWTVLDIGEPPALVRGGARPAAAGCLELFASGRDVGGRGDQFLFLHQPLSGDSSVTARVSAAELPVNGKIGVMLRENLTPGSKMVSIFALNSGGGKYSFIRREVEGASSRPPRLSTELFSLPNAWVRIERKGGDIIGSYSSDGASWTELSRVTLAFAQSFYGGIAATPADSAGDFLAARGTVCDLSVVKPQGNPPAAPTGLAAAAGDGKVDLDWNDNAEPNLLGYNVHRGAAAGGPYGKITAAPVAASSFSDTGLVNGTTYYYVVTALGPGGESGFSNEASATPRGGASFRRGDVDADGRLDISDAVKLLGFLFLGSGLPECLEAGDTDNSGIADISDAVSNLGYQFLGGAPPVAPGPQSCGPDPEPPFLGCAAACIP